MQHHERIMRAQVAQLMSPCQFLSQVNEGDGEGINTVPRIDRDDIDRDKSTAMWPRHQKKLSLASCR